MCYACPQRASFAWDSADGISFLHFGFSSDCNEYCCHCLMAEICPKSTNSFRLQAIPIVITGDVIEEGFGFVIVTVGSKWILLISIPFAVLGIDTWVTFVLPIHRLLWFFKFVFWKVKVNRSFPAHHTKQNSTGNSPSGRQAQTILNAQKQRNSSKPQHRNQIIWHTSWDVLLLLASGFRLHCSLPWDQGWHSRYYTVNCLYDRFLS